MKLKPCPFCGSEATITEHMPKVHGKPQWQIGCEEDFCLMSPGAYGFGSKKQAIKAWNTRTRPNLDTGNLIDDPLYKALDALYERGWRDYFQGHSFDPRGSKEWQDVLDLFRLSDTNEEYCNCQPTVSTGLKCGDCGKLLR